MIEIYKDLRLLFKGGESQALIPAIGEEICVDNQWYEVVSVDRKYTSSNSMYNLKKIYSDIHATATVVVRVE